MKLPSETPGDLNESQKDRYTKLIGNLCTFKPNALCKKCPLLQI